MPRGLSSSSTVFCCVGFLQVPGSNHLVCLNISDENNTNELGATEKEFDLLEVFIS